MRSDANSAIGSPSPLPMLLGSFMLFGVLLGIYALHVSDVSDPCRLDCPAGETPPTAPRCFTLSLAHVLAMTTAFSPLGVAAAWSGQNLQMALQSPLTIGAVFARFFVIAVRLFEMQLSSAWVKRIGGVDRGQNGSLISAALLGFTSALIVGPCVTAPLAGALIISRRPEARNERHCHQAFASARIAVILGVFSFKISAKNDKIVGPP